jgi:hypothetical protein
MSTPAAPVVKTVLRRTFVIVVATMSAVITLMALFIAVVVGRPMPAAAQANAALGALAEIQQRYAALKTDIAAMRQDVHAMTPQQLVDAANALLHAADVTP